MSVFCRHNRFTAECPICSKGTVLDPPTAPRRRPRGTGGARTGRAPAPAPAFSGPHVSAGPFADAEGASYDVHLERVPGGLRLAEWSAGSLRRRAPVLGGDDLLALARSAAEALGERDGALLADAAGPAGEPEGVPPPPAAGPVPQPAGAGVSRGRAGDFREELRVEALEDGRVRVARWVQRPGVGWQLQDAPPMLPATRFAEAIADASTRGVLSGARGGTRL